MFGDFPEGPVVRTPSFHCRGLGSVPSWGTEIPQIMQCSQIKNKRGTSLVVQWLRLHASNAGGVGLIPGWGTKIWHAVWQNQNKKFKISEIYERGCLFFLLSRHHDTCIFYEWYAEWNFHLSCFSNNWGQKNPIQKNWEKAVVKSVKATRGPLESTSRHLAASFQGFPASSIFLCPGWDSYWLPWLNLTPPAPHSDPTITCIFWPDWDDFI